jgi:hypothetical protein
VNAAELRAAAAAHFAGEGFVATADESIKLPLLLAGGGQRWGLALCAEQPEALAYLAAFEAAMQAVIDAAQGAPSLRLGIALDFASTAAGDERSYRRPLKKYSNSIVFEDLGLSLLLVSGAQDVTLLLPAEVNPFLRSLDRFIAGNR